MAKAKVKVSELETVRELNNELRRALHSAQGERDKFSADTSRYKQLYENQQKYNKMISDRLQHQERLVRTLTDALADKYYPLPMNVNVTMDYRIAKNEQEHQGNG